MTYDEDILLMSIMETIDPNDERTVDQALEQFARIYKEKADDKKMSFRPDPFVMKIVRQIIPEEFL